MAGPSSRRFISREEEAAQDAVYRQLDPQALEDDESEDATMPAPSAGTARPDAAPTLMMDAGEVAEIRANIGRGAVVIDQLDILALCDDWSALRSALAERDAECERLRADGERLDWLQEYSSYDIAPAAVYLGFDDIASVVTDYLHTSAPFNVRRMLDAARGVSSAAVAPAAHIGKHWRGCAACEAQANSTAHLFSPESDVGPFDAACVLCGHLHDGEVCPAVAPAAREETRDV